MPLSKPPRITKVEAFPIRLARDVDKAGGTAGSPTVLGETAGMYRWSSVFPALYSECFETALVKVTLSGGLCGWGEAQAPLAPRVASTIIEDLLAPILTGLEFDGQIVSIENLWSRMYQAMRVRGQTGGFMLDAISGIDLALWDLAGKMRGQPVSALIAGAGAKRAVPAYLSGVSGIGLEARAECARSYQERGFGVVKVFYDSDETAMLRLLDVLRSRLVAPVELALDALWRLSLPANKDLLRELERRGLYWLECPFPPEELEPHRILAHCYRIPLAVGESYRTPCELAPFLSESLIRFVQPDLGRCGVTETLRISREAARRGIAVVPHVSIALGPQIAGALHAAAAIANCEICEFNPNVLSVCNRYLAQPLEMERACYLLPQAPGLGVEIRWQDLARHNIGFSSHRT